MNVAELLDIALAGIEDRRFEMATLEQADIAMEAVSGLAQLIAELVENAVAFSDPQDRVRVTGLFTRDDYLITVSDHGVGIPEAMIAALNQVLEDPNVTPAEESGALMGIQLVARAAHRHGIGVRLVPAVPGTTARVSVPAELVSRVEEMPSPAVVEHVPSTEPGRGIFNALRPRSGGDVSETAPEPPATTEETLDLTRYETTPLRMLGHVVAMTDSARAEAEEFLTRVFGSLLTKPRGSERPTTRAEKGGNDNGPVKQAPWPDRGEHLATTTRLRVRVPGENFDVTEDEPSTAAAEGAIDIRRALTRFQQGRRSAAEEGGE